MSETVLKREESVAIALRSLYKKYGYLPYKMNKFESYDLYLANKDFLAFDGVITFNDTDGRLLALKPDVTLSIIKNGADGNTNQKVFYDETVYRISGDSKQFKEFKQVGLECIGQVGVYEVYETLYLAIKSLEDISKDYVLDISHLGLLSGVLEDIGAGERFNAQAITCIASKNAHELTSLCNAFALSKADEDKLLTLIKAYGTADKVLAEIQPLCVSEKTQLAYNELVTVVSLLGKDAEKVRLDFSVVNDRKYYNGIVFKGFIDGVYKSVLSGGRYDKLLARMHRNSGAIGFAVYLDLLGELEKESSSFDTDALILIDDATPVERVVAETRVREERGETVRVERQKGKLRFKTLLDLSGGKQC